MQLAGPLNVLVPVLLFGGFPIPEHDGIGDQPQSAQLLPLPILIALSDLAFLPVTNSSGDSMSAFSQVKLDQDATSVIPIINIIQQVQCLIYFPSFDNGLC